MESKKSLGRKTGKSLFGENEDEERLARARAAKQEEERLRLEMEKELKELIQNKKDTAKREKHETKIREDILKENCRFFNLFRTFVIHEYSVERENEESVNYFNCVQPFPYDPPNLNSFIDYYHQDEESGSYNSVITSCKKIEEIINNVDKYLNEPFLMNESTLLLLHEVKERLCDEIIHKYDSASFNAISDIQNTVDKLQFWKAQLVREEDRYLFWLWGWAIGEDLERKAKGLFREKMLTRQVSNLTIRVPRCLKYTRVFFRIIRTPFDILSWQSPTFKAPHHPIDSNLFEELLNVRKLELEALKEKLRDPDEKLLPWWYLEAYPPPETQKAKMEIKESSSSNELSDTTEEEIQSTKYVPPVTYENLLPYDDYEISKLTKESSASSSLVKTGCIPEYFEKVLCHLNFEPMVAENVPGDLSSDSDESEMLKTEKHTSFRASLYRGYAKNSQGKVSNKDMEVILKMLKGNQSGSKCAVSHADKRIFLDWNVSKPTQKDIFQKYLDFIYGKDRTVCDGSAPKRRTLRALLDVVGERPLDQSDGIEVSVKTPNKKKGENKTPTLTEIKAFDETVNLFLEAAKSSRSKAHTDALSIKTPRGGITLRQYHIVGEIYLLDLIEFVPQPKPDQDGLTSQVHYGDLKIKIHDFFAVPNVHFDASLAVERQIRQSSRISSRGSIRLQSNIKVEDDVELEDDDTIHMTIKLEDEAIWFSSPFPVLWDSEIKSWTTENLHDSDFNEEKRTMFLKLGITSQPLGVACDRWTQLPFKSFEIEPVSKWDSHPQINLTLVTEIDCLLTFEISEKSIILKTFQCDQESSALEKVIGYPFPKAINIISALRKRNVDIFPDWDTHLYVPKSLEKNKPLQEHLCYCCALASPSYCFKNLTFFPKENVDEIFFEMKEYDSEDFVRVACTPYRTVPYSIDKSLEEVFNIDLTSQSNYYPDLKDLIEKTSSDEALNRMKAAPWKLVSNVFDMLIATKLLSFT